MAPLEWKRIIPEDMIRDIETSVQKTKENKYAFQTGLKDIDFDLNHEELQHRGFTVPFPTIGQAEQALLGRLIWPTQFVEYDGTDHSVLTFHPQPVGYSGFMGCVTHSLTLTNLGLFEVGRYPGVRMDAPGKYWQWFIHCRLAVPEQVQRWQEEEQLNNDQFVISIYRAITGL